MFVPEFNEIRAKKLVLKFCTLIFGDNFCSLSILEKNMFVMKVVRLKLALTTPNEPQHVISTNVVF